LETIIFGYFAAKIKGARIYFDIADPFGLTKPIPFESLWKFIERLYISLSDIVTVPHFSRAMYYSDEIPFNLYVLENVPSGSNVNVNQINFESSVGQHAFITLGYFGTLDEHRGLEDLIELVKRNKKLRFNIAGRGLLSAYVESAALSCDRINFSGALGKRILRVWLSM